MAEPVDGGSGAQGASTSDGTAAPPLFGRGGPPFHVVLVHPEIAPNTGSIGRLCLGTGCVLHLVEPLGFSLGEKAVRRAGLDYWKHVQIRTYPDLAAFLSEHHHPGARFFLLSARRGQPYAAARFQQGDYLLFGRESTGLPPELVQDPPGPFLRIPHRGDIRSLNLANAASVVVYEGLRQLYPGDFGLEG